MRVCMCDSNSKMSAPETGIKLLVESLPPPAGHVCISMSLAFDGRHPVVLHVPCAPTDTLGDLRQKLSAATGVQGIQGGWDEWVEQIRDRNFSMRCCTLPEEVTIGALELEPGDLFEFQRKCNDSRPIPGPESIEQSVQRLLNVRAARECYKERCEKARQFNEMIEATKSELTMSDAECRNIICLLVEKQGTLTVFEAVDIVLDNSRNYPSTDQAHAMIHAFNPDDDGIPGETCYKWGSFGDWMASFMLNNRPCAFRREKVYVQPPFNVLGMPGYSATYYGLHWRQTYTYAEARPIVAKFLIGNMGWLGRHPVGVSFGDDPYTGHETT